VRHTQEFATWASINPAEDPALRTDLLAGRLEVFACAQCNARTPVTFETLYHDTARAS